MEDLPRDGHTEEKDREPKADGGSPGRPGDRRRPTTGDTASAKRIAELESLVQAVRRVVDKQKSELDRAQKTTERLKQQRTELQRQLAVVQDKGAYVHAVVVCCSLVVGAMRAFGGWDDPDDVAVAINWLYLWLLWGNPMSEFVLGKEWLIRNWVCLFVSLVKQWCIRARCGGPA